MFNTINYHPKEYIPYEKSVTVTENKAPTDDSIKLLNEFKEKALKDTMMVFRVDNNSVNAVFRYVQNEQTLERNAVVKFKFNNQELIRTIEIDDKLKYSSSRIEIQSFIIDKWRKIVESEIQLEDFYIKPNVSHVERASEGVKSVTTFTGTLNVLSPTWRIMKDLPPKR